MIRNIIITCLCFIFLFLLARHYRDFFSNLLNPTIDILQSKFIAWGKGWNTYESHYGGSEFTFTFTHSHSITFMAESPNEENGQGIAVTINHKLYRLTTPGMGKKKLTIVFKNTNQIIHVDVKHYCAGSFSPCDVKITRIMLDKNSVLHTPSPLPTTSLAIFGDSISVNNNYSNFSFVLSDKLHAQLHDASIFGSTISNVPHWDWALARFNKDIVAYQPTYLLIFLGTNDLGDAVPLDEFTKSYDQLLNKSMQFLPKTIIIAVGLLTRKDFTHDQIESYSNVIKNESEKYHVPYIDPYAWLTNDNLQDAVHPNLASQPILTNDFYESVQEILKQ